MNPTAIATVSKARTPTRRFRVLTLLALVLSVASLLAAWRSYLDLDAPRALARRFQNAATAESRIESASALGRSFEQDAETSLRALRGGLNDPDPRVRVASAGAIRLGFVGTRPGSTNLSGPGHEATVLALLEAASDRDLDTRRMAILAISAVPRPPAWTGGPPREVVSVLIDGSTSPDPLIREGSIFALGSKAWRVPESRAALLRAIRDPAPAVRSTALRALADWYSDSDPEVFLAILGTLNDSEPSVHQAYWSVSTSLRGKPPIEALPGLIKALGRPDSAPFAVAMIGGLGPQAAPAVPALIALFENSGYINDISQALAAIGPAARPAIPALAARLRRSLRENEPDTSARDPIAHALGVLGPDSTEVRDLVSDLADRIRARKPGDPSRTDEIGLIGRLGRDLPAGRAFAAEALSDLKTAGPGEQFLQLRTLASFTWDDRVLAELNRRLREERNRIAAWQLLQWIEAEEKDRIARRLAP